METTLKKFESSKDDQPTAPELVKIMRHVLKDSKEGFRRCMQVVMWEQINAGQYALNLEPHNIRTMLDERYSGHSITVKVDESVLLWLMLDGNLLDVVFSNAIQNAVAHGKEHGDIDMLVNMDAGYLVVCIWNEAGPKHGRSLQAQAERGRNFLLVDVTHALKHDLGSPQSTFQGLHEMQTAASILGADISLTFEPARVCFCLKMKLEAVKMEAAPETRPLLPEAIIIAADDDATHRAAYMGLRRKLGLPPERFLILGETYQEATQLHKTVLEIAAAHGERNTTCIFDQNLDRYPEGQVYGTEVTRLLRESGFGGLIFIRSANDTVEDLECYRKAGANDVLSKQHNVKKLAIELLTKVAMVSWQ